MAAWEFQTLQNIAKQHGWHTFISMQNYYNLIYREEEREMLPYCQDTGVGCIPVRSPSPNYPPQNPQLFSSAISSLTHIPRNSGPPSPAAPSPARGPPAARNANKQTTSCSRSSGRAKMTSTKRSSTGWKRSPRRRASAWRRWRRRGA